MRQNERGGRERDTHGRTKDRRRRECGGGGGVTERLCENEGGEGERYRE